MARQIHHAVHGGGQFGIVGGDDQRATARQLQQGIGDLGGRGRVQVGRGFIDQQQACIARQGQARQGQSEEHTSELQSPCNLVCRLLLEKKKKLAGRLARRSV